METYIFYRYLISGSLFFILFGMQYIIPIKPFSSRRWLFAISNIATALVNNILMVFIVITPLATSQFANSRGWGLLNIVQINLVLKVVIAIIVLDMIIYFQHRLFHKVKILARFHMVHHVDPRLDSTSGIRFHPVEIILSNFIKVSVTLGLGIPMIALIIFESLLLMTSIFNHSNIRIAKPFEKGLRLFLITPELHLIHHSVVKAESQSNFGFSVPFWDKLYGTYKSEAKEDTAHIVIGIDKMPEEKYQLFPGLLLLPFKNTRY